MTLPIKDGNAAVTALKSTLDGTDHVVHRHIDSMPATAASSGTPAIPAKVLMVGAQHASGHCVPLTTNSSGYLNTVATITGGATAANQATANGILGTIDADTSLLSGCVDSTKLKVILQANSGVDIGDVDVASVTLPTTVVHGKKTVTTAGTEVALASTATLKSGVTIKALSGNTGLIYVGINPVTSADGFELNAKESVFVEVADPATIYIDSAVNGEGVTYIGS